MVLMHRAIDHVAATSLFHVTDGQEPQGFFDVPALPDLARVDAQDLMVEIVAVLASG